MGSLVIESLSDAHVHTPTYSITTLSTSSSIIIMKSMLLTGAVLATVLAAAADDTAPMINNAIEFLARASSTSEVLTLNLTNLLILLVLKALIFGFGLFSVGGAGRSADTPAVTQSDLTGGMCFLMYTSGAEE